MQQEEIVLLLEEIASFLRTLGVRMHEVARQVETAMREMRAMARKTEEMAGRLEPSEPNTEGGPDI